MEYPTISGTKFETSPGTIKSEEESTEDVSWTLSEHFHTSYNDAYVKVYKGIPADGVIAMEYISGVGCDTRNDTRVTCVVENATVGMHIANVSIEHASLYSAQVKNGADTEVEDSDAMLYIYSE